MHGVRARLFKLEKADQAQKAAGKDILEVERLLVSSGFEDVKNKRFTYFTYCLILKPLSY